MGTVIGMIQAFDAIAIAGDISPSLVADGIKVALITTVAGLIVAMILQVFYNYLLSKIDSIVNNMEDASISLIDILAKKQIIIKNCFIMNLTKILKALAIVNFALAVIICLGFFLNWVGESSFLGFTYFQTIMATAATIIFSLAGFVTNPKNAKSVLVGLGAMALIVIVSWAMATDSIPTFIGSEKYSITTGDIKFVGTSIIAVYILLFIGVVGMIGSEIYRYIIKR
jgi:hypothetical protein